MNQFFIPVFLNKSEDEMGFLKITAWKSIRKIIYNIIMNFMKN